jgi:hypothetical protein
MVEANEIAKAARQLVRNTIDAVAVEALVRDRVEALERQLAEARAEIERVRDGNRYFQLEAIARRELAEARAGRDEARNDLRIGMANFDSLEAERDRLAADNARLREAITDALGRHQVTHIHAALRAALAGKE